MGKSSKTSSVTKASSSKPATGKVVAKAAPAKTAPAAKAAIPAAKSAPTAKAPAKAVPAKPVTKAVAKPAAKAAASAVPAKPAAPVKPATKAPVSIPAKSPAQVAAKTAVNGSAKNGSAKTMAPASSKASANGSAKAMVKEVPPPIKYKNPFQSDELSKWRELLLSRRAEISGDIAGLVKDAMEAEDGHTTPNHIAERGSDADLQDLSLGVAGEEKDVVWQIDRALRKIDELKPLPFGLCEFTKESIPRTRLQLIPWTPLSIEGATHMEKSNLELEDLLIDD